MLAHSSSLHSAYAATIDDWCRFLSCWHRDCLRLRNPERSLIKRSPTPPSSAHIERRRAEIATNEARLGVALPRSYVDFLVSYVPTLLAFDDRDFVHVSAVERLASVHPDLAYALQEADCNAPDEEYLVYGTEQRDTTRSRHAETSLVVGMHDDAPSYMIVLHPEVLTIDGEMEAEVFFHAGTWRAPSFAEVMRFLYWYSVRSPPHSPAVSQDMMRGTCADLLPMRNVWWK